MKIFLDTSDTDIISKHCETGLIDGVTTNPTLMMQAGRDPVEVLRDIMPSFYNKNASISAEVVGETAEEMVLQSEEYRSVSNKITIKVLTPLAIFCVFCRTNQDNNKNVMTKIIIPVITIFI